MRVLTKEVLPPRPPPSDTHIAEFGMDTVALRDREEQVIKGMFWCLAMGAAAAEVVRILGVLS